MCHIWPRPTGQSTALNLGMRWSEIFLHYITGQSMGLSACEPSVTKYRKKTYTAFFLTIHFHQRRIYEWINNTNMVINYHLRCWRARNQMLLSRFVFERDGIEHSSMLLPTMFAVQLCIQYGIGNRNQFDCHRNIWPSSRHRLHTSLLCFPDHALLLHVASCHFSKIELTDRRAAQRKNHECNATGYAVNKTGEAMTAFLIYPFKLSAKAKGKNWSFKYLWSEMCIFLSWQALEIGPLVSLAT